MLNGHHAAHDLPLELITLILSHLSPKEADERKALLSFSLVSRTWLYLTRRILFAELELPARKLKAILLSPSSSPSDLFSHPLATIPLIVVSLKIIDHTSITLKNPACITLISNFKNITTLHVKTSYMPTHREIKHQKFIDALPTLFGNITSLTLFTHFYDVTTAIRFICSFPLLESLDLQAALSLSPSRVSPNSYEGSRVSQVFPRGCRLPSSLRALRVVEMGLWHLLPWLVSLPQLPPVRTLFLKFKWGEVSYTEHLNTLLQRLGSTLRYLGLRFEHAHPKPQDGAEPVFTLKHTKHLQLLRLHLWKFADVKCHFIPSTRKIRIHETRFSKPALSDTEDDTDYTDTNHIDDDDPSPPSPRKTVGHSFVYVDPILSTYPFHAHALALVLNEPACAPAGAPTEFGDGGVLYDRGQWTIIVPVGSNGRARDWKWTREHLPRLAVGMGMKVVYVLSSSSS